MFVMSGKLLEIAKQDVGVRLFVLVYNQHYFVNIRHSTKIAPEALVAAYAYSPASLSLN